MADENLVLGIELGDTKKMIKTVGELETHIKGLGAEIKKISKNDIPTAIQGRDAQGISKIQSSVKGLTKDTSKLQSEIVKLGKEGILNENDVKSLTTRLNVYAKTMESISLETLVEETRLLHEEQAKLVAQREAANNPAAIDEIVKREQLVGKQLVENIKHIQRINSLNEQRRNPTEKSGGASGIVSAFQSIGSYTKMFAGYADNLGITIQRSAVHFGKYKGLVDDTSIGLGDLLNGISETFENATNQYRQLAGYQQQVSGFAKGLSDWSNRISSTNKAIVDSTGQLSRYQKILGMAGGAAGKLGSAVGKVSTVMSKAMPVIQGVSVGLQVYDSLMGRSSEQIKKRIQQLKDEAATTRNLNELLREGSQEARQREIDALQQQIVEARQHAQAMRESGASLTSTGDQIRTVVGHILGSSHVYGQAADEIRAANARVEELNQQMARLTSAAAIAAVELANVRNELEREAKNILDEVNKARDDLFTARVEIIKKERDAEQALLDLRDEFNNESNRLQEERIQSDRRIIREHLNELESLQEKYNADVRNAQHEHLRDMKKTEENYLNSIAKLTRSYQDDMLKYEEEFAANEIKAELAYVEDRVESQENYNKRLAKMEEDFNKDRIKRQKDLENELFAAEMDNDGLRLFMLRRQADQEEEEAQQQHQESLDEEAKSFDEERKQKQAEYEKDRAERLKNYEERKAERVKEHTEALAQSKRSFDEEIAQAKAAHAQKLADQKFAYDEERAQAVSAHRKRMEDLSIERAEEDSNRLLRLQERRQEAEQAFQIELEYFERRERILSEFIGRIEGVQAQRDPLIDFVQSMGGELDIASGRQLQEILERELYRLGHDEAGNARATTHEENVYASALAQIIGELSGNLHSASQAGQELVNVDLSAWMNDREIQLAGVNLVQSLTDGINTGFNEQIVNINESMQLDLTHFDYATRQIAGIVEGITNEGGMLFQNLAIEHQLFLEHMGLNQSDWNMMTVQEQQDFLALQSEVIAAQGTETLGELRETAERTGNEILDNFESAADARLSAQSQEMRDLETHFSDRESNENQFRDDVLTAQELANQDRLTDEQYFADADAALRGAHHETMMEEIAAAHENELAQESAHFDAQQELAEEVHNAELEQLTERFETENEMWIEFMDELGILFDTEMSKIFRGMSKTIQDSGNQIIRAYSGVNQAVVQSVMQAQAMINSQAQQRNRQQASGGSMLRPTTSSGAAGASRAGGFAGLFAAKGALIDRPTLMVAGEGQSPELVVPFDESKGLPKDIMQSFGDSFANNIGGVFKQQLQPTRVGGSNDHILSAILYQLKNMQMGMALTIDRIEVGSNVSRQEIREHFGEMQKALVDVINTTVNIQ